MCSRYPKTGAFPQVAFVSILTSLRTPISPLVLLYQKRVFTVTEEFHSDLRKKEKKEKKRSF